MKRTIIALVVVGVFLGVAVSAEYRLGKIPREDPLGRELLFLPSPEMVKLLSLGNPGLAADILYLWSIQYYSLFQPNERFLYLEPVYNLITDLDPLYFDAYRIGALIMQIQTGGDQEGVERVVRQLFDKGLRNLPDSWELAEAAAWDMHMRFQNREAALSYAEVAAERPEAPPRIKRMVGVWRDKGNKWTVDDSVAYWRQAVTDAIDEYDRKMCVSKLYDAVVLADRGVLDPRLRAFAAGTGRCADDWEDLIRVGLLERVPLDLSGNVYGIDAENCLLVPLKKIKDQ